MARRTQDAIAILALTSAKFCQIKDYDRMRTLLVRFVYQQTKVKTRRKAEFLLWCHLAETFRKQHYRSIIGIYKEIRLAQQYLGGIMNAKQQTYYNS